MRSIGTNCLPIRPPDILASAARVVGLESTSPAGCARASFRARYEAGIVARVTHEQGFIPRHEAHRAQLLRVVPSRGRIHSCLVLIQLWRSRPPTTAEKRVLNAAVRRELVAVIDPDLGSVVFGQGRSNSARQEGKYIARRPEGSQCTCTDPQQQSSSYAECDWSHTHKTKGTNNFAPRAVLRRGQKQFLRTASAPAPPENGSSGDTSSQTFSDSRSRSPLPATLRRPPSRVWGLH
jgi:hypothetical protein